MTKLRIWMSALLVWLFVFFNIERLHEPLNVASFVYVLAAGLAVFVAAYPPMRKALTIWLVLGSITAFVILKATLGYPLFGQHLPVTITEALAITLTVYLGHRIAWSIRQFEEGATQIATFQQMNESLSFDRIQSEIYREVQRAREFNRPLSLVTFAPTAESATASVNRLIEEVHKRNVRLYLDARLVDVVKSAVHDCDIIARRNGHFVLLLTETDLRRIDQIVERFTHRVQETLGMKLRIGRATFPDQEITLTGLLERAESQMDQPAKSPANSAPAARTTVAPIGQA